VYAIVPGKRSGSLNAPIVFTPKSARRARVAVAQAASLPYFARMLS
jgi:hypothetical protein